ncbi:MAG: precorrin-6A reductase [Euryarchaeota archaeon]|nr:precorrin-6A reductase [Euryarchaeota archaeon]
MLWVLAGTRDACEIISRLSREGFRVVASATTQHGAELARRAGSEEVVVGQLSAGEMLRLIEEKGVRAVIDATHPFAREASENAMLAAERAGVEYIRYERESLIPEYEGVHLAESFEEAAQLASKLGEVVFYTAGVKNLPAFLRHCTSRVVVRVLPTREAISRVEELGVSPENIIAMYPRFSAELERALLRAYCAEVLVTKESGPAGGVEEKLAAAREERIPVVVVRRPEVGYPRVCRSVEAVVQEIKKLSLP